MNNKRYGIGFHKVDKKLKPMFFIDIQKDFFDPSSVYLKRWDKDHVIIQVLPKHENKLSDTLNKATFKTISSVRVGTYKVRIKDLPLWMGICDDLDGLISEIFQ